MFLLSLEALSMALGVVAIGFSIWVIRHFLGTVGWLRWTEHRHWQPRDWIAVGIVTGFAGEVLDGVYWSTAWAAHYFDLPVSSSLMNWGVVANIPFRHVLVIAAAYCHIRAAGSLSGAKFSERINQIALVALSFGGLLTALLVFAAL